MQAHFPRPHRSPHDEDQILPRQRIQRETDGVIQPLLQDLRVGRGGGRAPLQTVQAVREGTGPPLQVDQQLHRRRQYQVARPNQTLHASADTPHVFLSSHDRHLLRQHFG